MQYPGPKRSSTVRQSYDMPTSKTQSPEVSCTAPNPTDARFWSTTSQDMMQWQTMASQINNTSMLAEAYGAMHGQPQSSAYSMEWLNNANTPMMMDPANQPNAFPHLVQYPGQNLMMSAQVAQLQQQLNAIQLQNQQQKRVTLQQNLLLAQIQNAQEVQVQAERQAALQQLQSSLNSSSRYSHTENNIPRRTQTPNMTNTQRCTASNHSSGVAHSKSPNAVERSHSPQLPADVSKAMEAVQNLRQMSYEEGTESGVSDSRSSRNMRANSHIIRDRHDQDSWGASNSTLPRRNDIRHTSTHNTDSERISRSIMPSIIIGSTDQDQFSRKANAVGMRIGRRTAPMDSGLDLSNSSFSEITEPSSADKDDNNMGHAEVPTRPSSSACTLIHPRRQPRGPPMESFFANNFLARRSLRTRREAMSKLCASPRAASFSGLKVSTSTLLRKT